MQIDPHFPGSGAGSCLQSGTSTGLFHAHLPGFPRPLGLWALTLDIGSASKASHILINGRTWGQAKISYSVVYYSITNHL